MSEHSDSGPSAEPLLPKEPIHLLTEPLSRFLHVEAAGGVVLLICTLAALALAVKLKAARLPEGVGWSGVLGGGCLAGIGFTMAIFIAGLALDAELLDVAKIGILAASALNALIGMGLLVRLLPPPSASADKKSG